MSDEDKERLRQFGRRILSLREEQGLKQDNVMMMSGIDRSFISNIENGVHSIATIRLKDLAEGLRVDTIDFFKPEADIRRKGDAPSSPRYLQLADYITKEIESGLLQPGEALPPESEICRRYGYSRFAVREALAVLRGRGVVRTWGATSFVASDDDLQPIALRDGEEIIARMPDPNEAFQHGMAEGVPVLVRRRRNREIGDKQEIYPADRYFVIPQGSLPYGGTDLEWSDHASSGVSANERMRGLP